MADEGELKVETEEIDIKKLQEEFADIKNFDFDTAMYSDYNLVAIFDKEVEKTQNKDLKKMCNELLYYKKGRKIAINSGKEEEVAPYRDSYFQKLYGYLEKLLINVCTMWNKERQEEKIHELKVWFLKKKEQFLSINHMKERTEKAVYEDPKPEPIIVDELVFEMDEKIRMAQFRTENENYEKASRRLKKYARKEALHEGMKVKDKDPEHSYFNEMTFKGYTPNFDIYTKKNETKNFNFTTTHFYNAKNNKNKDNVNLPQKDFKVDQRFPHYFAKREIKSAYSYHRPDFIKKNLEMEKNVQNEKNKMIQNERNQQELKVALGEFGLMRAKYKE
ncbi:MAG: hypothetical protein MJ252_16060, partial [archaeon]|nr:hypothetical protein [archaeon]